MATPKKGRSRLVQVLKWGGLAIVVLLVAIQLVPYGRDHSNPKVVSEPQWPDKETRAIAVTACYDCHSNQTKYPWYSNIAPFSWWLQNHIDEGRDRLNFSEWNSGGASNELAEVVQEGSMPPNYYEVMHSSAKLSPAEKAKLIAGLRAIEGTGTGRQREGGGGGEGGEGGE